MPVYKIGPISYGLNVGSQESKFFDIERFQPFASREEPNIKYNIHCGELPHVKLDRKVFDTEKGWYLGMNLNQWVLCLRSREKNPSQIALLSTDFLSGDIYISTILPPSIYYFPLSFPMGLVLTINLLTRDEGMLLHACGVIKNGTGLLFAGVSGSGKSTIARLWQNSPGVRILNDDKIIVRKEENGFQLYGTPWYGEGGQALPFSAPLERILLIYHAQKNQVRKLDLVDSITRLMITAYAPYWDNDSMDSTLATVTDLCQAVPCYELGFKPDDEIVDYVSCL